jgi:hypothetical protein
MVEAVEAVAEALARTVEAVTVLAMPAVEAPAGIAGPVLAVVIPGRSEV